MFCAFYMSKCSVITRVSWFYIQCFDCEVIVHHENSHVLSGESRIEFHIEGQLHSHMF